MKRRTLDLIFVLGGVAITVLAVILGFVLQTNANFADRYVKDQLSEQQIVFKTKDTLVTDEAWRADLLEQFGGDQAKMDAFIAANDLTSEAGSACLNEYAGTPLDSGKKAECYANEFIRLHLKDGSIYNATLSADPAKRTPTSYTYASIGAVQSELRSQVAKATDTNDPLLPQYQAELTKVNSMRDTLFRGETLRGLLLTSYGFSIFGQKAELAAIVCFVLALVLFLATIAGLIHFFRTPKEELVGHHGEQPAETPAATPTEMPADVKVPLTV